MPIVRRTRSKMLSPTSRQRNRKRCGVLGFLLQTPQFLFGLDELPLQGVILVLPQITILKLLFCLGLGFFQGFQLFLCSLDGILQKTLLL